MLTAEQDTAYFNPRPPRGGRHVDREISTCGNNDFNPRPPRGGRHSLIMNEWFRDEFQSTPPSRGATLFIAVELIYVLFQSTPPSRGATLLTILYLVFFCFQSTPPSRGATIHATSALDVAKISIHAPLAGGDSVRIKRAYTIKNFNPRPPRGGRQDDWRQPHLFPRDFNPRPPRGGRQGTFVWLT